MANRVKYNEAIANLEAKMLVSVEYLMANTALDFNITPEKIIPYVVSSQELRLEPVLGTPLYRKLQENSLPYEYQYLKDVYVDKALIHYAFASYLSVAPYSIGEGGVYKHLPTDAEIVGSSENAAIIQRENYKAMDYENRLKRFLCAYSYFYPEYNAPVLDGESPSRISSLAGGFVLDITDPAPKNQTRNPESTYCGCGIEYPVGCTTGCSSCGYDPTFFDAEFWTGYTTSPNIPTSLSTFQKYNRVPTQAVAAPSGNYFWMVSNWDFEILQGMNLVPLGTWDNTVPTEEAYVKTISGGLYYIRVKIVETYENSVRFNIKIIT